MVLIRPSPQIPHCIRISEAVNTVRLNPSAACKILIADLLALARENLAFGRYSPWRHTGGLHSMCA